MLRFFRVETKAHQDLKRLALAYLRAQGCIALATEVKCPISRYRVDVAGYSDARGEQRILNGRSGVSPLSPFTIVIECKQSRADFLRDSESVEPLLDWRDQLERMRLSIEEHRIRTIEPHLRQDGTSLFAELDDWDFSASRLPGYRKVMRQLRRVDEKLHGETKFFLMAKYRLADRLYLAAPRGVIRAREVPPGWGLLECEPDVLDVGEAIVVNGDEVLHTSVAAPPQQVRTDRHHRLLRNIAVAASRWVE